MAISSTSRDHFAAASKWNKMDTKNRFYEDFKSLKPGALSIQKVMQTGPMSQFIVVFRTKNSKLELYQRYVWKKAQHEVSKEISKWKRPVSSDGVSDKHSLIKFFKKTFCCC